jgi:S1-C subfamily serine protease
MERISRLLFNVVYELAERPALPKFRSAAHHERDEYSRQRWEAPVALPPSRLGIRWTERLANESGLPIQSVQSGLSAHRAGLRPGDRIVKFAEREIHTDDDLLAAVYAASGKTTVEVLPSGKTEPEPVALELPGQTPRVGLAWRDDEAEPGTPMVVQVLPGSPADMAGVRLQDRLHKVAGQPIGGTDALYKLFRTLPEPIELEIERWGRIQTVQLKNMRAPE